MNRLCVCGKLIKNGMRLCPACYKEYGTNSAKWPEWVQFLVGDIKREMRYESKHRDEVICDDVFMTPQARANLQMAKQFPNMEFEEFREYLHDTGNE